MWKEWLQIQILNKGVIMSSNGRICVADIASKCCNLLMEHSSEVILKLKLLEKEVSRQKRLMYNKSLSLLGKGSYDYLNIRSRVQWEVKKLGVEIPDRARIYNGDNIELMRSPKTQRLFQLSYEANDLESMINILKSLSRATHIQYKPAAAGFGIRLSPIPVTKTPIWIRKAIVPNSLKKWFLYFDVRNAEFVNLLFNVDPNKYHKWIIEDDVYTDVSNQLQMSMFTRTQMKQFCMSLVSGATEKAVSMILQVSQDQALGYFNRFWNIFEDVLQHLEDVYTQFKLTSDSENFGDIILDKDYYTAPVLTAKNNTNYRMKVFSAYVRDSFVLRFAKYVTSLVKRMPSIEVSYAWVDCLLISFPHELLTPSVLPQLFGYKDHPFKLACGWGRSWHGAQAPRFHLISTDGGIQDVRRP